MILSLSFKRGRTDENKIKREGSCLRSKKEKLNP